MSKPEGYRLLADLMDDGDGDVHSALELVHRHPAVCDALRIAKFEECAHVRMIRCEGPHHVADVEPLIQCPQRPSSPR
jgi:hypothetical protein